MPITKSSEPDISILKLQNKRKEKVFFCFKKKKEVTSLQINNALFDPLSFNHKKVTSLQNSNYSTAAALKPYYM